MTFEPAKAKKRKDDELLILTILAVLFTGVLIWMDFGYSSVSLMDHWLQAVIWICQIILAAVWVLVFAKWKDPKYDYFRKIAFYLATALMLWVGIHHATAREDKQVIIDSKENADKP